MLFVDTEKKGFNLEEIRRGTLICAKHKTWPEGQSGMVTEVSEDLIRVQYLPSIQNVMNHYFIPAEEGDEWEIRYSNDGLRTIMVYPEGDESKWI